MRDLNSDKSKLVVLYLEQYGESTVEELKTKLCISLLELYPVLGTLQEENYIEEIEQNTYKAVKL